MKNIFLIILLSSDDVQHMSDTELSHHKWCMMCFADFDFSCSNPICRDMFPNQLVVNWIFKQTKPKSDHSVQNKVGPVTSQLLVDPKWLTLIRNTRFWSYHENWLVDQNIMHRLGSTDFCRWLTENSMRVRRKFYIRGVSMKFIVSWAQKPAKKYQLVNGGQDQLFVFFVSCVCCMCVFVFLLCLLCLLCVYVCCHCIYYCVYCMCVIPLTTYLDKDEIKSKFFFWA